MERGGPNHAGVDGPALPAWEEVETQGRTGSRVAAPWPHDAHPSSCENRPGGPSLTGPGGGIRKTRHTSPSPLEILNDRKKAVEAAASLSCSEQGSPKRSQNDVDQSESEQESDHSLTSDTRGPEVTPGTSDNII
ncbi:hypothetical protein NDU88_005579 [Pleurodeles waltl]|uniref:Uncharacterized protein n=1 Tax=Pleurodeles waltl TaxID=8319 RepID=A0AAV7RIZ2_PLEWA|nr:hypothetical protein NDU88_005579 [Pleurodeles waltl]